MKFGYYKGESMTKASLHFLVLVFASLLASLNSFAQISVEVGRRHQPPQYQPMPGQQQILREQVMRHVRPFEELRLSELLRLSYHDEMEMELISLSLMAQHQGQGQTIIELVENGRPLASDTVRRNLKEVRLIVPARTLLQGLALQASSDIYIESITAEVIRSARPGPGPGQGPGREQPAQPNSLITIPVHQSVRGYAVIPLDQLSRSQGLSLIGAQIERVVVMGQPSMYGRSASVQVELNRRPVGIAKYLVAGDRQTPIQVQSIEEVRSGLALIVSGDAQISEVRIRVGMVRQGPQGPQFPQSQRIYVGQEISNRFPLELSRLLGYESRLIRSVTIEARTQRHLQAQVSLLGGYGELQGAIVIQSGSVRGTINLRRPMAAHELRLESFSPVLIDSLELEFEQSYYPRY